MANSIKMVTYKLQDQNENAITLDSIESNATFRHLAPKIPDHNLQFEFILLLDLKEKKIVRKFEDILSPDRTYKMLNAKQLYNHFTQLQQQVAEQKEQISKLLKHNTNYEKQSSLLEQTNKDLQDKEMVIQSQSLKIADQNKEIQKLSSELVIFKKVNEDLEQAKAELTKQKANYNILENQYKNCDNEKENNISQIKKFKKQIEQLSKENQSLEINNQKQKEKINKLKQKIEDWQSECRILTRSICGNTIASGQIQQSTMKQSDAYDQNQNDKIVEPENKLKESKLKYQSILNDEINGKNIEIQKLEKQVDDYEKQIRQLTLQSESLQAYFNQQLRDIYKLDEKLVIYEKQIANFENSKTEIVYRTRLSKVIESTPRVYISEINFAVEEIYRQQLHNTKPQAKGLEENFQVYELIPMKDLKNSFNDKIYEPSDIDFSSTITKQQITEVIGIQGDAISANSNSYDEISIFECSKRFKDVEKGTKFAFKRIKHDNQNLLVQGEEEGTLNSAQVEILGLLIAQNLLEKFYQEIGKNYNVPQFKFQKPYIFGKDESFKCYFQKKIEARNITSLNNIKALIISLNNEESNEFYNEIKLMQAQKQLAIQLGKRGNISILMDLLTRVCNDQIGTISSSIKEIGYDIIDQEFGQLINFLDDCHIFQFPITNYYSAYQLHNDNKNSFVKYNGGHMKFNTSDEGKFLSAFTYYTIIKSHRQICVSHLQGVGGQLYDPLISSSDGVLSKLDQGINEIRTIESLFETAKPQDIGEQYLHLLGINRKNNELKQQIDQY